MPVQKCLRRWLNGRFAVGLMLGIGGTLVFVAWSMGIWPDGWRWFRPFIKLEDNLAQWVMAFVGIIATGVSIWAVFYVKKTFEVANSTLRTTQRMANDQEKFGQAQVRPYLIFAGLESICVNSCEVDRLFEIEVYFKNFGHSPAVDVRCDYFFEKTTLTGTGVGQSFVLGSAERISEKKAIAIGPNEIEKFKLHSESYLSNADIELIRRHGAHCWTIAIVVRYDDFLGNHYEERCGLRATHTKMTSEVYPLRTDESKISGQEEICWERYPDIFDIYLVEPLRLR